MRSYDSYVIDENPYKKLLHSYTLKVISWFSFFVVCFALFCLTE